MEVTRVQPGYGQNRMEPSHGWLEKAEAALLAKRHAEAVGLFDSALKDDPFSAKAHCGISRAYWEQGRTEDALNSLTRALELEPDDQETVLQCSTVFRAFGKEDFAREVLQTYLGRHPQDEKIRSEIRSVEAAPETKQGPADSAEFLRKEGVIQFERGRVDRATACLEMAIEHNPDLAEAHNDLGVILLHDGNLKEALEHLYRALDLNPRDPEILSNSAKALSQAGEFDVAAKMYREYLRLKPDDDETWEQYEDLVRRSSLPRWSGDAPSPEVADIYVEMAKKLKDAGDLSGSAQAVEKAIMIKPGSVDALFVLASLHAEIGQRDDAADVLEQALLIDPSSTECTALLKAIRNGDSKKGKVTG
ncbi:MAG: tetratricopeptide repeat protein [Syntrophobacter sp.]